MDRRRLSTCTMSCSYRIILFHTGRSGEGSTTFINLHFCYFPLLKTELSFSFLVMVRRNYSLSKIRFNSCVTSENNMSDLEKYFLEIDCRIKLDSLFPISSDGLLRSHSSFVSLCCVYFVVLFLILIFHKLLALCMVLSWHARWRVHSHTVLPISKTLFGLNFLVKEITLHIWDRVKGTRAECHYFMLHVFNSVC